MKPFITSNIRGFALHGRHDRFYRFSRTRVYTVDAGRVVPSMIPPLSICVKCVKRILRVGCVDVAVSMLTTIHLKFGI